MKKIFQVCQLLNTLSLDVAAGAATCAVLFARVFHVELLPQGWLALAITVWIIYTVDHLLDAKLVEHPASSRRHRFHQQHFRSMALIVLAASMIDLYLVNLIRPALFQWGLAFSVGVVLYLAFSRLFSYVKELMASLLYTGGVLLPSLSLYRGSIHAAHYLLMVHFFLLVTTNIILFAWLSYKEDLKDHYRSVAILTGSKTTRWILVTLFALTGVVALFLAGDGYFPERLTLLVMSVSLFVVFLFPAYFRINERFRVAGDWVFLFPAILFL